MAPKEDLETLFEKRREIDRALLEQHSRELVILFTDIVGSTQYFEAKGDIAGLDLVRRHNALLFPIVQSHQGWIVKTIGDAIMAVFEQPVQAVRCAMEMQRALARLNATPGEEPIHVRIGAHCGRALVEEGKDVYGDAVNTAARVVSEARGDEILISQGLADRLPPEDGIALVDRGSFQPKGKAEPVQLLLVHWREGAPPAPARPLADPKPPEVFVLELQVGARGLKIAALDGAADKGAVKAYADVEISQAKLDQLAERFDTFMRATGTRSYVERVAELGGQLSQAALSERARRRLTETQVHFLRLHLDDQLVSVPWELMHDGNDFLALRFAMGRVVSARTETSPGIRGAVPVDASTHALVVSIPSGDLDAAVREGEAVAGLLRDGYLGEVQHVRGPVKRAEFLAALKGCGLLHFAGHAEQPTPSSPGGFRVADGIVTAEEIAEAVGASAPALVFANGCHASAAEAFRGSPRPPDLASALLLRGVRHFVGPRWEIADEDALTFALRFYERALSGTAFGEAVRHARLALREPAARPLSFAGYVLYGDPRGGFPRDRIRLSGETATRSTPSRDDVPAISSVPLGDPRGPPKEQRAGYVAAVAVLAAALVGGVGFLARRPTASTRAVPSDERPGATAPQTPSQAPSASAAQEPPENEAPQPATGPVRLCMLPFKNISGEKELDQLRDGIAEALMTDFSDDQRIRVIERGQIDLDIGELEFSNGKYVDPRTRADIGKIHGAEVVLLGGFQRAGNVVRANARFVQVETGEVLRAARVEVKVSSLDSPALFKLQDELAAEVKSGLPEIVTRMRP